LKVTLFVLGFPEYGIQLANALIKKIDVMIVIPRNTPVMLINSIDKSVIIIFYDTPNWYTPYNLLVTLKVIKQIFSYKPDVIHLVSTGPWICIFLPILKYKFLIVSTIHDPKLHFGEERIDKEIVHYVTQKFSDLILVHGEYLKRIVLTKWGVPSDKVHVILHGDFSILKQWKKKDVAMEKNTILFFGRIEKYKGLQYLLQSRFYLIKKFPNLKIIIAGNGDLTSYGEIDKDPFLEIHNYFIPINNVPEYFQRSSIVVLPYIDASQSGVVPLAYTLSRPVIVTNVGSIPEVVINNKTGIIIQPKNSLEIAKAIEMIFNNDELRNKMINNIDIYTHKELAWDNIANRVICLYRESIVKR
jgi:glycosyltransferase involved in cell wall biosynthesis